MRAEQVKYLVVHCSATPTGMDIGAEKIDEWHRGEPHNFRKIGYHIVIRRSGDMESGRGLNEMGAHAKGFNDESLGICLIGGVDENGNAEPNYDKRQLMRLREVLGGLKALYPAATILGHRDLESAHARLKECPCFDTRWWWLTGNISTD